MKIVINGNPIPQVRYRFRRFGNKIITYDPLVTIKKKIRATINGKKINPPIVADITFYMPIPKSGKHKEGEPHIKLGDIDNYLKFVFDVLQGIIFENDKLIYKVKVKKIYSNNPRTEINIYEDSLYLGKIFSSDNKGCSTKHRESK